MKIYAQVEAVMATNLFGTPGVLPSDYRVPEDDMTDQFPPDESQLSFFQNGIMIILDTLILYLSIFW